MISLKDVRKDYSSEVTIGPITLDIPAGGVTALVGPNGAGKSTVLTIIGRLLGADEGSIEIAGYDVAQTKSKDLAKIVSILRQENHFITRLTVRQLVGFGRFPYTGGRLTREDEAIIDRSIDFFELTDLRIATSTNSRVASVSARMWRWCCARTPNTCCLMNRSTTLICATQCR